tara:strand:+ start:36014 stop:36817 length:804 start_codon:yes stop_codon:yes gene_type:complete
MLNVSSVKMNLDTLEIRRIISEFNPDLVINTIALTNIEFCENNPEYAHAINVSSAQDIATISHEIGARFVHISTDHIFNGGTSWNDEQTTACPINVYADTKLSAESAVLKSCPASLVIRTNFFGCGTSTRGSFSDWVVNGLSSKTHMNLFNDVYFTPILVNDLIDMILELVNINETGIYHIGGSDRLSKYEFALMIADIFQFDSSYLSPCGIDSMRHLVKRPKDMSLSSDKARKALQISMPQIRPSIVRLAEMHKSSYTQILESSYT